MVMIKFASKIANMKLILHNFVTDKVGERLRFSSCKRNFRTFRNICNYEICSSCA